VEFLQLNPTTEQWSAEQQTQYALLSQNFSNLDSIIHENNNTLLPLGERYGVLNAYLLSQDIETPIFLPTQANFENRSTFAYFSVPNTLKESGEVVIFPNPSFGTINFVLPKNLLFSSENAKIVLFDAAGKQVYQQGVVLLENRNFQLDVHELLPGAYVYSIFSNNTLVSSGQFIKQ
jgi:hypothetical protein